VLLRHLRGGKKRTRPLTRRGKSKKNMDIRRTVMKKKGGRLLASPDKNGGERMTAYPVTQEERNGMRWRMQKTKSVTVPWDDAGEKGEPSLGE